MREIEYKANGSTVKLSIEGLVEAEMLAAIVGDLIGNMSREVPAEDILEAIEQACYRWRIS